jgi:hypothetical protein
MAARRRSRRQRPAGSAAAVEVIASQVFIGLPWTARTKYERIIDYMRTRSPISFVVVGRNDRQDAEDLFEVIKERISSSSYGIFDATGGNPNVSLEYGYAEAVDIPRALYLSSHASARRATKDAPIISDLAGKRRNQYKQEAALKKLLTEASKSHPYTVRFERFLQSSFKRAGAGEKKRARALSLKVIHTLDGVRQVRRADIVQRLQADQSGYSAAEVDDMLKKLHREKLIRSQQGPYAKVHIE